MNIGEHLKKPYWVRRVNEDTEVEMPKGGAHYVDTTNGERGSRYRKLTSADFLNEIESGAHEINSRYWSSRPVRVVEEVRDENGELVYDEQGNVKTRVRLEFEDMETTRCSLPRRMAIAKASHAAAEGYWIGNSSREHQDIFQNLLDWKDAMGLDAALFEVVLSLRQCCDAALYMYQEGGMLTYQVFSYLYGDELFSDYDEERRPRVWRKYNLRGREAVDIISAGKEGYQTWVRDGEASELGVWWERVKAWFKGADGAVSEDGWRRVAWRDSQIGGDLCQCVYFRVDDIPSGCVADEIASWERLASYVAESMKTTAFPDKFVKATKITSLPSASAHGRIFGVEGSVEELKVADMKTVSAGDMSNIATTALKMKHDAIMRGSMSVIIEPEILKSGADSSSALRLMFTSEIQDAQAFWVKIVREVRYMTEVLKALVAKIEGNGDYRKIRTSVAQRIWIPQNFAETVDNTTKLVYAGILSRADGASEVDLQYPDTEARIAREQAAELWRKAYVPAAAKAAAAAEYGGNAAESGGDTTESDGEAAEGARVDNRAARRDIARVEEEDINE